MRSGIRIDDKEANHLIITLPEILEELSGGASYDWTIVFLEASGDLGAGESILDVMDCANGDDCGYVLDWYSLLEFSKRLWTLDDITLLGDGSGAPLHRYSSDRQMVSSCAVSIQLIDAGFWLVFAEDDQFITRLQKKFRSVKQVTLDDLPD